MMAKEIDGTICETCGNPTYVFSYVEESYYVCDICRVQGHWEQVEDEDYVSTAYWPI